MKKLHILPFYAVIFFVLVGGVLMTKRDHQKSIPSSAPLVVRTFAQKMKVFPVDLIALNHQGPLTRQCKNGLYWRGRYEFTSGDYVVFCDFLNYSQHISTDDLVALVAYFETATPKEKALILTTIYIFEVTRRKVSVITNIFNDELLTYQKFDRSISTKQWEKWIALLEQHADDSTVAFPAITTDEDTLKKKWEEDQLQVYQFVKPSGIPIWRDRKPIDDQTNDMEVEDSPSKKIVLEEDRIVLYSEFLNQQYLFPITGTVGCVLGDGNSSAEPKTLGDIATQLLMSRLPYGYVPK